jgi:hypothetical protein
MSVSELRGNYIIYIGAGAVATGGIISMLQALPVIFSSVVAGLRDLGGGRSSAGKNGAPRTEHDMPMWVVLFGSLALVLAIAVVPYLGLGLFKTTDAGTQINWFALVAAGLIVLLGFLFVTVSSRLTGEVGSSSNPISGMTVAALLIACLVFVLLGHNDKSDMLTALTIAAVVCIASSNGGTTSQDLKTGFLVGATPSKQQWAIVIGALTSAIVIGGTLLILNEAGTVFTKKKELVPAYQIPSEQLALLAKEHRQRAGGQYADDPKSYVVFNVGEAEAVDLKIPAGKYLADDETGKLVYFVDPAINGKLDKWDDGRSVKDSKYSAPKTQLMAKIITGIFSQKLPWGLVLLGALIAVTLELSGVPSLPFAVGVYLPLESSMPIFLGGAIRFVVDRWQKRRGMSAASESEAEMSPGSLLSTGYIAGATIAGVIYAFIASSPSLSEWLAQWQYRRTTITREMPIEKAYENAARMELGLGEGSIPPQRMDSYEELVGEFKEINEPNLPKYILLPPDTKLKIPQGTKVYEDGGKTPRLLEKEEEITSPSKPTLLGEFAQQLTGSEDKAGSIYENNKDALKLPETLPKDAVIKVPQRDLTALIAAGSMVLILLLVGLGVFLKMPTSINSNGPVAPERNGF